jgi:beta-phosphoglucomutase
MPVRAIVFDFDGVLADSESLHLRSYQDILSPHGISLTQDEYCARYLGFDDEGAFRQIAADYDLLLGDEELELLMEAKTRRFQALVSSEDVLYPRAAACVRRLGAVWPLGIASGALRHEIELMLSGSGLQQAFRFIVGAGDTEKSKPAPDPYLRAAELHGVPASECLAIEDSHWGLMSARAAGMTTIGITHTYPREALGVAHVIIDSLDELTDAFVLGLTPEPPRT